MLDGQQRITSLGRFFTEKFAIKGLNDVPQYFSGLAKDQKDKFLQTKLTIYICDGPESEIKEWFKTINIAGVPLNEQELSNAIHSGPFVTKAKEMFSNSQNANIQKWSKYISGTAIRQDYLRTALEWVSKNEIDAYMSVHRNDTTINDMETYFNSVMDWVTGVFTDIEKETKGLNWGELYEKYHNTPYDSVAVSKKLVELYSDVFVKNKKGIYEYILGGCVDNKILEVRMFDEHTKSTVYTQQTTDAKAKQGSNCPLCAMGSDSNKDRIYKLTEMDAEPCNCVEQRWTN